MPDDGQTIHKLTFKFNRLSLFFLLVEIFFKKIQHFPTLSNQTLAMSKPNDKAKDLHVLGEMNVGEVGFENVGQILELESNVMF